MKVRPCVLMVTAYSRDETLMKVRELHISLGAVLTKPVTGPALQQAVAEARLRRLHGGLHQSTRQREVKARRAAARVGLVAQAVEQRRFEQRDELGRLFARRRLAAQGSGAVRRMCSTDCSLIVPANDRLVAPPPMPPPC